jgi:hypothetical protein
MRSRRAIWRHVRCGLDRRMMMITGNRASLSICSAAAVSNPAAIMRDPARFGNPDDRQPTR